jgi:hypothetical protein
LLSKNSLLVTTGFHPRLSPMADIKSYIGLESTWIDSYLFQKKFISVQNTCTLSLLKYGLFCMHTVPIHKNYCQWFNFFVQWTNNLWVLFTVNLTTRVTENTIWLLASVNGSQKMYEQPHRHEKGNDWKKMEGHPHTLSQFSGFF